MAGEFELIRRFFQEATSCRSDVLLGIGDDCALLQPLVGSALAVSSDTLVSGRHFTPDVDPEALGHKALAVNLSDLAAMGAEPAWVSLCLTLPQADEEWLAGFTRGFAGLADGCGVQLVGGDTTRGPLSVSVMVQGFVDPARALRRGAARAGDLVYVSGTLGDAGLALRCRQDPHMQRWLHPALEERLDRPLPRLGLGMRLGSFSRCAIDISDGLGADLGHVCEMSGVGALLDLERLPMSDHVRAYVEATGDWPVVLSAGDDYELVFTVPPQHAAVFDEATAAWDVPVTRVGVIEQAGGLRARAPDGGIIEEVSGGYEHFRA